MGDDPRIELASVKVQLDSIQTAIEEMKSGISYIVSVDKTVLELKLRLDAAEERLAGATQRLIVLEKEQNESSAYINKIKGFAVVMSIAQALIVSGSGWLLTTLIGASESVHILQENVTRISAEQVRLRNTIENLRR